MLLPQPPFAPKPLSFATVILAYFNFSLLPGYVKVLILNFAEFMLFEYNSFMVS